jgi:peroxiredoxin
MFLKAHSIRLIAILSFFSNSLFLTGQSVSVRNFSLRGQKIVFASQFGNQVLEETTAQLDDNGFAYKYNESLHSGIYYIIFSDSSTIEFMYDSICPGNIKFEKSPTSRSIIDGPSVTKEFDNYLSQLSIIESVNIKSQEKDQSRVLRRNQSDSLLLSYANKIPGSLLDVYLRAQLSIEIPVYDPPKEINNKDSAIWIHNLNYYSKHYFDRFDFSDSRLIYTPLYTNMIDYYLDILTPKECEKINQNINLLMRKTDLNSVYQKFTAEYLLNKYQRKKNDPLNECVYIHLVENYFLKSGYTWISNDEIAYLTSEYNRRKPALLGEIAPEIKMNGLNNVAVSLDNLSSKLIVIYFYNYDCPLCEKITPELRKIVSRYDYLDIKVLAICTGDSSESWKNYINSKKVSTWINVFDNDAINQVALRFNLSRTPTLFLLDENKQIIDKNFTVSQLEKTLYKIAIKEKN